MSYQVTKRKFDVVIVGAGGSGMRASLQLARAGLNVAVLSKAGETEHFSTEEKREALKKLFRLIRILLQTLLIYIQLQMIMNKIQSL